MQSDLRALDAHIVGLVGRVRAQHGLAGYRLQTLPDLRAGIEAKLEDPDPAVVADARALLAYLEAVEDLIRLALETHGATWPP